MQSLLLLLSVVALRASCPIFCADRGGVALLATPWQYTGDGTLGAKCLGGKARAILLRSRFAMLLKGAAQGAIALPIDQAHNLN